MPLPPEDCSIRSDSNAPDPEFEFTKVECLLYAFHTIGNQVREQYYDIKPILILTLFLVPSLSRR